MQRDTKQRRLVLETVRSHRDHPTADAIYLDVKGKDAKISRGTVYRNLKNLCEDGEIIQIKVPGADRFDLRCDYHYHILCLRCGQVCDVPIEYQKKMDEQAQKATGYAVARHRTVFEGLCPDCQKANGGESPDQ